MAPKPWQFGSPTGPKRGPGGVRKRPREIEDLARAHTTEAVEALVAALKGRDRVPAAMALLAYGWGKPKQTYDISVNAKPVALVSDAELLAIARGGSIDGVCEEAGADEPAPVVQ